MELEDEHSTQGSVCGTLAGEERLPVVVSGLVLLVHTSEARSGRSRQGMQWHALTHKSATGNPLSSPAPRLPSIAAQYRGWMGRLRGFACGMATAAADARAPAAAPVAVPDAADAAAQPPNPEPLRTAPRVGFRCFWGCIALVTNNFLLTSMCFARWPRPGKSKKWPYVRIFF